MPFGAIQPVIGREYVNAAFDAPSEFNTLDVSGFVAAAGKRRAFKTRDLPLYIKTVQLADGTIHTFRTVTRQPARKIVNLRFQRPADKKNFCKALSAIDPKDLSSGWWNLHDGRATIERNAGQVDDVSTFFTVGDNAWFEIGGHQIRRGPQRTWVVTGPKPESN
ncbi:MAG: hypothetical protein AB7G06_09560 [Bdellovibrionales bacterium]